jgi:hypothetical protein
LAADIDETLLQVATKSSPLWRIHLIFFPRVENI